MPNNEITEVGGVLTLKERLRYLAPDAAPSHLPGSLFYDTGALTLAAMTGITNVTNQIGQEDHILVYNNSGDDIDNGMAVYINGSATPTYPDSVARPTPTIDLAKADALATSVSTAGLATEDIVNGSLGIVTRRGIVRDFDTSGLSLVGPLFLSATAAGELTNTKPAAPNKVIVMGGVLKVDVSAGQVLVQIDPSVLERQFTTKDYSFTSNGIGAGTYYSAGYYDAPAGAVTLTQASLTQAFGSANHAYAAHAFAVFGAAGAVDAGVVGLRVNGTSITDLGVRTGTDSEVLTADITSVATDQYLETVKKWIGTITYELYVVTPTPTAYSLAFNYGLAKYEDFGNRDFYVTGIEVVGLAGANDASFDMSLLYHSITGWTYSVGAFVPGNGTVVDWSDDMAPEDNLVNNEQFAWKHVGLTQFVDGSGSEGIIVRIVTGTNNSVQAMDTHVEALVDPI